MNKHILVTISSFFLFISMAVTSSASQSAPLINVGWGPTHYHGGGGGYGPGPGGYYNRGGFYFGGGWIGPNVVINVPVERYAAPVERYYVRECDNVEVCDSYGQCWLERYCD